MVHSPGDTFDALKLRSLSRKAAFGKATTMAIEVLAFDVTPEFEKLPLATRKCLTDEEAMEKAKNLHFFEEYS